MKKIVQWLSLCLLLSAAKTAWATEKISLLLDWFVNPDHATIIVAQQKGYFAQNGLEVEIIEPADPSLPPKLVASGKADLAVDYQPQLLLHTAADLPLVRVGSLIATPLNSLVTLKQRNIRQIADLKGKKIGYSVSGFEESLLAAMLASAKLSVKDVELVNVNWSLSPSLLSGQVDAVIGAFRNFELNQLAIEGQQGVAFYPEEHGVPAYDELVLVANRDSLPQSSAKISAFLTALEQATIYLLNHPEAAWAQFVSYKPQALDNEINRRAWQDTIPRLAHRPRALDARRYQQMATFMQQQGLIKTAPRLADYAVELP